MIINDQEFFKTIKEKNIISFDKTPNSAFGVIVRLNYDKSLQSWEEKSYIFLMIIFTLLIFSIFLVLSI